MKILPGRKASVLPPFNKRAPFPPLTFRLDGFEMGSLHLQKHYFLIVVFLFLAAPAVPRKWSRWQPTAPQIDRDPMSPRENCFREGDRQQDVNRRWAETSFDMQHLPDFER